MKTYFNYGEDISSKNSAEAIAMVHGCGPIIGFGSAEIDNTSGVINISPLPDTNDPMYRIMVGRLKQWKITKGMGDPEGNQTNFAGIAKDGTIFGTDQNQLQINIQGSKGSYNEVLVFAHHVPVSEPVSNPVTFMAFWSEGNESFYELYQRSIDPYYPKPVADRNYNFNENDGTNNDLNYDSLEAKVAAACTYYANNANALILIGIYGTGNNAVTNATGEKFALVPYNGDFPDHFNYTPGIHQSLKLSLSRIEKILGVNSSSSDQGTTSIEELLAQMKQEITKEMREEMAMIAMPVGSIILWDGDQIPEGWAEYTNAAGRVVVGFSSGGIQVPTSINGTGTSTILGSVGSLYNPVDGDYAAKITASELPRHRHGVGVGKGGQDNSSDDDKSTLQNWDNRTFGLNGDVGDRGATVSVANGGVYTSHNFTNEAQSVQNATQLNVIKLPKSITLRYIIKVS